MPDLSEITDDLKLYLGFYLEQLQSAEEPADKAAAAMAVCAHYESLGIAEMLLNSNTDVFVHHLIRSAQTRLWLFDQVKRTAETESLLRAGYLRPFIDALAGGQMALARAVAARETDVWASRYEYEEDFCAAHALHRIVLGDPPEVIALILDRFEQALQGDADPRLHLCRVLLAPDQAAADKAFSALLAQQAERIETFREETDEQDEDGDALVYPNLFVYAEGLAWLTLLEHAGLVMDGEYRFCPGIARHLHAGPFEPTLFPFRPL